jgi:hypothetical protein
MEENSEFFVNLLIIRLCNNESLNVESYIGSKETEHDCE